jgi:Carboxypeptidase regulatory-like domain
MRNRFAGVVLALAALAVPALPAQAQERGPAQRVVQGKVLSSGDAPVTNAVVYLKDMKSLAVKSFITSADGTYRFGQLTPGVDYSVFAELNGKKSSVKTVSAFDSKNQFIINLHLATE